METIPGGPGLVQSTGKATEKNTAELSSRGKDPAPPLTTASEDVPDPDEDDLDDLDGETSRFPPS